MDVREANSHAWCEPARAKRSGRCQKGVADVFDALLLAKVLDDELLVFELLRTRGLRSDGADLRGRPRARR